MNMLAADVSGVIEMLGWEDPAWENLGWIVVFVVFCVAGRNLMVVSKQREKGNWWIVSAVYGLICIACLILMVSTFRL